ncbi:FHA domain-containing protein [Microbacterium sp.]|uniref:FHA domain-containing protein n=1 Tax=Microbacterium sp. TaxID=51671 RepID=UPI002FDFAF07
MQTTYRPGHWYLIVIPGALVALPPDVPGDVVAGLWERLPEQKTLATVVDVLTTHAGGSFAALPSFVAAVAEGSDVRIALRGDVSAQVDDASGDTHELSGNDVTTWSERFIGGATRIEITVESADSDIALPVQGGVVRSAGASAELESSDAAPLGGALGPTPVVAAPPAPTTSNGPDAVAAAPIAAPLPVDAPERELESQIDAVLASEVRSDAGATDASADEPGSDAEEIPASETPTEALDLVEGAAEASAPVNEATLGATGETLASDDDFDQLWGATVHSVPGAPVPPAPLVAPAPLPVAGDHDGATISAAELRALRQQPPIANDAPTAVLPVTDAAAAGRIRVSTGQVVALDRTVIIGRRPRSTRASGANLPHLVAVESPQQDISRSHLEVRPEGDTVVVIDLHTTNGSTLLRPGADPMRLHPGEQTLVLSGDVVDLGDGVTVAFEDLP